MGLKAGFAAAGVRLVALVVLSAGLLAWQAAPGAAHTRTLETTNIDSRIVESPGLEGVTWKVHTGGLLIEVVHRGDGVLVVEGYEGEPYLRIGPDGVERNRNSPATYLSEERFGRIAIPPNADASAEPDWRPVDDEPRHIWHDHRTHWMSPEPPPFVSAGPLARGFMALGLVGHLGTAGGQDTDVTVWEIPLTYDGTPATLTGELLWREPPAAWPWLLLGAALTAPGLLGLRRAGQVAPLRAAAVVVFGVAAINAIHLVDDLVAWPSHPLDDLFGLLHTGLFLTAGLAGSAWAWRVESGRRLALGIGAGAVLYHQGLVHAPMLLASEFPTVWPESLIRATVGLALAQAVVVGTVLAVLARRARSTPTVDQPSSTTSSEASIPASR